MTSLNKSYLDFDENAGYYNAGGISTLAIIRAKLTHEQFEGFLLGNIIAYGCRANFKGQFSSDLDKIAKYSALLAEMKIPNDRDQIRQHDNNNNSKQATATSNPTMGSAGVRQNNTSGNSAGKEATNKLRP